MLRRAAHPRVRLYATVRSAHLERARVLAPATILYRERRYDFDPALTSGLDLLRAGPARLVAVLAVSGVRELEVNEPLMVSSARRTLAAVAVVRLSGLLRRRPVRVVTYAIANDDPFRPAPAPGPAGRARRHLDRLLVRLVARSVDRVAFGTEAAAELYDRLVPQLAARAEAVVLPGLPAACPCPPAEVDADPGAVLFVGALEERKGVPLLMRAWPDVVAARPDATLTLVGTGPLLAEVRAFVESRPETRLVVDPPREEVHRRLRAASVLVLLSQRTARWREQVGLPIVEGLAHGCSVVASDETGLAGWLAAHGHAVVPAAADAAEVAAAIVAVLDGRRPREDVLADLPVRDGRLEADAWLFRHPGELRAPDQSS